jgi:hypothetical protein
MPRGVYDRTKGETVAVEPIKVTGLKSGDAVLTSRINPAKKPEKPTIAQVVGDGKDSEKFFPVRMLKGYRPIDKFKRVDKDGEYVDPPELKADQDKGLYYKLTPGEVYALPLPEAREVMARGLAERADPLPEA